LYGKNEGSMASVLTFNVGLGLGNAYLQAAPQKGTLSVGLLGQSCILQVCFCETDDD